MNNARILKSGLLLFIFLFSSIFLYAQDTIIKVNGERLQAKIIEVSETYILYKPFSAADSMNARINTYEISRIYFQNGDHETIHDPKISGDKYKINYYDRQFFYQGLPRTRPSLFKILKSQNDPAINMFIRDARKYKLTSTCLGWSGIPIFVTINYGSELVSVSGNNNNNNNYLGPAIFLMASSVIAVETVSIIMNAMYKKKMFKAVNRYNANIFE